MTNLSGTNLNNGAAVGPQGEGRESPSNFPTYPAYKDSGVEWLGEVPEHWSVLPVKLIGWLKGGAGFPHDKQGFDSHELDFHKVNALASADGQGVLRPSENTVSRETAKELGAYVFPKGTIVFAKVGAALLLGRLRTISAESCIDNNMMGFIAAQEKVSKQFALYSMGTIRFDLIANPGAVPSLNEGQIGNYRLAIPCLSEQIQITRFLDHETARIDALIEEQQRLIELLKEKRQAVISHAVTKGLDPTVPMKDSGVEWLGEVPEHWQIAPLKYSARVVGRIGFRGYTTDDIVDEGDGALTLSPSNMIGGSMNFDKSTYISWDKYHESPEIQLRQGDVVLVKTGSTYGRVAFVDQLPCETTINPQLAVFKAIKFESKFLFYLFESTYLKSLTKNSNTGGTMPTMTQENIGNYKIPMPGNAEMELILGFIDAQVKLIEDLVSISENSVSLLNERRSALISAAVTGKIDVRGWQPPASTQAPKLAVAEAV